MAATASRLGFRRMISSIPGFPLPAASAVKPPAEPSTNLFVSGLSKRTTTEGLREAFARFGEVVHARVVTDRVSGYSKGFGFVRYATLEDAAAGIKGMDGKFLDGWVIFAEYARPRPPASPNNDLPRNAGSEMGEYPPQALDASVLQKPALMCCARCAAVAEGIGRVCNPTVHVMCPQEDRNQHEG